MKVIAVVPSPSDLRALKKITKEQKAAGVKMPDVKSKWYIWSANGRLISIDLEAYNLKGSISFQVLQSFRFYIWRAVN